MSKKLVNLYYFTLFVVFFQLANADWWKPKPKSTFHIQYATTPTNLNLPVDAYNIDMDDTPQAVIDTLHANGKKVICYLSCGSWENWRVDARNFPSSVKGENLDGWPGEKWLDVSNTAVLLPLMGARLDRAVAKKCDGVDPDNMDGYTQDSGFTISYAQQITYNKAIAAAAHARNLSCSLKNDLEQIVDLVSFVDFAVNEACYKYDECDYLLPYVQQNKAVYIIEYSIASSVFCPDANSHNYTAIRKNRTLDEYTYNCWGTQSVATTSKQSVTTGITTSKVTTGKVTTGVTTSKVTTGKVTTGITTSKVTTGKITTSRSSSTGITTSQQSSRASTTANSASTTSQTPSQNDVTTSQPQNEVTTSQSQVTTSSNASNTTSSIDENSENVSGSIQLLVSLSLISTLIMSSF